MNKKLKTHNQKLKIKKGDKILVIAGKDRNKTGLVERVLPKKHQVVVTGINMVKKHLKRSAKNPQGGIIDLVKPLDSSNVMLLDPTTNKPTRTRSDKTMAQTKTGEGK
jgi:large subunit ribosomal protein L24